MEQSFSSEVNNRSAVRKLSAFYGAQRTNSGHAQRMLHTDHSCGEIEDTLKILHVAKKEDT
jgi:hypothetical protein